VEAYKKVIQAFIEDEEKQWKVCGAGRPKGDTTCGCYGQTKDTSPSTSAHSYGTPVANGWARETTTWAESNGSASTSANVQQASGAMLPVWHDGAPETALPKAASRSTVSNIMV